MSLTVAGLVPMSSVDWPGKLVATVFLQGCPWDCGYCQNPDSRDARTPGRVDWADVLGLLRRRRGLLDGVVFSGGEATRQPALEEAMRQVRELGFGVGLHTAGPYPGRLERVLPLVDWLGLDVKALPESYAEVVGVGAGVGNSGGGTGAQAGKPGRSAWRCLDLALAEQQRRPEFTFEVRTTVCPSLPGDSGGAKVPGRPVEAGASPQVAGLPLTVRDAPVVARRCRERGVRIFALQEARGAGVRPAAAAVVDEARAHPEWRRRWARLVAEVEALGFEETIIRAA